MTDKRNTMTDKRNTMTDKRYYTLPDGSSVPSVTTILDAVGKPQLIEWAARIERAAVLAAADETFYNSPADLPPAVFRAQLEGRLPSNGYHKVILDSAAAIGSEVHAAIEAYLGGAGITRLTSPEASNAFQAWRAWHKTASLHVHLSESTIWSRTYSYAGTLDLLGDVTVNGIRYTEVVIDWKTSSRIRPENEMQVAAYGAALHEMGHTRSVPSGLIVRASKDGSNVETHLVPPEQMRRAFSAFLAAKTLFDFITPPHVNQILPTKTVRPATGPAFGFAGVA
jgi:hypothetical protein